MLDLAAFLKLLAVCAPSVAPETMASIVAQESSFDPLAIHVNGGVTYYPETLEEAISLAETELEAGESVDLGLGQINSANLGALGLTVEAAFEPCTNLRAASALVVEGYGRARDAGHDEQDALQLMLSLYNTGSTHRGFTNGYVEKVLARADEIVPALATGERPPPVRLKPVSDEPRPETAPSEPDAEPADPTNVFASHAEKRAGGSSSIMVFE